MPRNGSREFNYKVASHHIKEFLPVCLLRCIDDELKKKNFERYTSVHVDAYVFDFLATQFSIKQPFAAISKHINVQTSNIYAKQKKIY